MNLKMRNLFLLPARIWKYSTDEIPGFEVANKGSLNCSFRYYDYLMNLKKEGDAREFVNKIQNIRKDSGFELTDRINVQVSENAEAATFVNSI